MLVHHSGRWASITETVSSMSTMFLIKCLVNVPVYTLAKADKHSQNRSLTQSYKSYGLVLLYQTKPVSVSVGSVL